jgi:hypothetical protein
MAYSQKIIVRVKPDSLFKERYMITSQAEGYPESVSFIAELGKTEGLTKADANELADEVAKEEKESNPDREIVVRKLK